MEIKEAIAIRIKELCKEKNITMYRLTKLSNVPHSTITSILDGTSRNPGTVTISKLCNALGITLSEFFDSELFM